ncbi:snaclec coagulation factor IX-binding protein subunit A-like [Anneissia japonica]|uniref:snaclec coagulation factor IX-binding protein subunit A-like n=1 Tax=Anneissia japonica TaxID=1529436 RepID=UPI0014257334|nr:snaclec coagulation factor IX-binding protein subunit A-like [Anneissia japonica]
MRFLLLIGIFIAVAASPSEGYRRCPTYWVPYKRSCYRVFSYLKTWHEAESFCSTSSGSKGHLVTIGSSAENRFVATLWRTSHGGDGSEITRKYTYWIGLKRWGNSWRWSDGSPYRYTNWARSEPNNKWKREDCVHQWKKHYSYLTWNDNRCSKRLSFVCET